MNKIRICILGSSNIADQVIRLVHEQADELAGNIGAKLELVGVGIKNVDTIRCKDIDKKLFVTNIKSLIRKSDIVVELIGGVTDAKEHVFEALSLGKTVITANKMLLSHFYEQLMQMCEKHRAELYYESSVCGAIPIVYALRESLKNDRIESVIGIVNSTTNYVLEQMSTHDLSFEQALQQAQDLGFAEIDSNADIDGIDIASKGAILASLAFSTEVSIDQVDIYGIRSISLDDIKIAKDKGFSLKLLFVANRREDFEADGITVSVRPTLLPLSHPLANVNGIYNAILIDAAQSGRLMFYGRGTGDYAVASSILNDITRAAVHKKHGIVFSQNIDNRELKILSDSYINSRFYINLTVDDRPGVLSKVTGICAKNDLSIDSLVQDRKNSEVRLSIFTHETTYRSLKNTTKMFADEGEIISINSVLFVENN